MQSQPPAVLFKDHGARLAPLTPAALAASGLASFFDNPQFSDLTVIVPSGQAFRCHQVILTGVSSRLHSLLSSGNYFGQELPLAGADSEALVSVLKFMYTGEVALSASTVIPLYDAANKLEITCLCTAALQYLNSVMRPATMPMYLEQALTCGQGPLVDTVMNFYETRYSEVLANPAFPTLSEGSLSHLIACMAVRQPLQQLIDVANAWCNSDPMRLSTAQRILNPHLPSAIPPAITPPPQGEFVVLTPQQTNSGGHGMGVTSTSTMQQQAQSSSRNMVMGDNVSMQITVPPGQVNLAGPSMPVPMSLQSGGQTWTVQLPSGPVAMGGASQSSGSFQLVSSTSLQVGADGELLQVPSNQIPVPPSDASGGSSLVRTSFPVGHIQVQQVPIIQSIQGMGQPEEGSGEGNGRLQTGKVGVWVAPASRIGGARGGSMDGEPEALHHHVKMQLVPGSGIEEMDNGGMRLSGGGGGPRPMAGPYKPPGRTEVREGRSTCQTPRGVCSIANCSADLSHLREYHQRFRICDYHLKVHSIMRDGIPQRFCQQCGRFHDLAEFDGSKRSCRARLQRHNARRRKRGDLMEDIHGHDGGRWTSPASFAHSNHNNNNPDSAPRHLTSSQVPQWNELYEQEGSPRKQSCTIEPGSASPDSQAAASTSEATLGSVRVTPQITGTDILASAMRAASDANVDVPPPQAGVSQNMPMIDVGPATMPTEEPV